MSLTHPRIDTQAANAEAERGLDVVLIYRDLCLGGVQNVVARMANALAADGFRVGIFLTRTEEIFYKSLDSRIEFVCGGSKTPAGAFMSIFRHLRHRRARTVFSAVPHFNIMCIVANAMLGRPSRVVISEHSDTENEFRHMPWGLYKLSILLIPLIYRFADAIIAVSAGTADSLARFGRLKRSHIRVVYNPVFDETILARAKEDLPHPWCDPQYSIIVSAGRMVHQKDFPTLIRAFAQISGRNPQVRLVILGDGPERPRLLSLVVELDLTDKVNLPGAEENPFRWFGRSRVFVLSSRWEGFGNVLVEALGCGCSVVSTDCPSGPSEILDAGRWGRLVPVGDANALSHAIEKVLANPMDSEVCVRRARQFGIDPAREAYKEILFPILTSRPVS